MKKSGIIYTIKFLSILMVSLSIIRPLEATIFTGVYGTYIDLNKNNELLYANSALTGGGMSYFMKEGLKSYEQYIDPLQAQVYSAFSLYAGAILGLQIATNSIALFAQDDCQRLFFNEDSIVIPSVFRSYDGTQIALTKNFRNLSPINYEYDETDTGKIQFKSNPRRLNTRTLLEFSPCIFFPLGNFKEMAETGYGGMINLTRRNIFVKGFESGIDTGFFYLPGKDLIEEGKPSYDRFLIVPLLAHTGYKVWPGNSFYFIPAVSLGAAYFNSEYIYFDETTLKKTDSTENFIDPMVKIGISMEYMVTGSLSISTTAEYGMFIEKDGPMCFLTAGIGLNYKLQVRP